MDMHLESLLKPESIDYSTIKHLLSEAEMQQQAQQMNLATHETALLEAQAQHATAKAAYDESAMKVDRLKLQFRDQIMDEGLRQQCRWNDMYYKLVEWKNDHNGDTTVPCDPKSSEEVKKLNRWVINQRTAHKYFLNGDKKHIKDHRIDALNKIDFVWSVTDKLWENNFEELKRHHLEHGTFDVTHKQNRRLATFVSRLRTAMNHKNENLVQQELTQEKINKLNSINFTWALKRKQRNSTTRDTVKFDVMFNHLVSFKEIYGHLKVNKLEKEWKKGVGKPEKRVFRRLPLFMSYVRKEQLLFAVGQPSALDENKVELLTDLGVQWKKPLSEPRKSTGGESTRKKRKKAEENIIDGGVFHYPEVGNHLQTEQLLCQHEGIEGAPDVKVAPDVKIAPDADTDAAADVAAVMDHTELPTIPAPPIPKMEEGTTVLA